MLNGQIKLQNSSVILQSTRLDWIVERTLNVKGNDKIFKHQLMQNQPEMNLKAFWELEESGIKDNSNSVTDEQCLKHFHEKIQYVGTNITKLVFHGYEIESN